MSASMVVPGHKHAVKQAIRKFHEAGYDAGQIHVIAYDNEHNSRLFSEQPMSRLGLATETFALMAADLFRSKGQELRYKLLSLGLSLSAVSKYEQEIRSGQIVVLADREHTIQENVKSSVSDLVGMGK